eukprot:7495870-Karenia_brevis.AAC.1
MVYKGAARGDLEGRQTVNKGELLALAELLERTNGPIRIAIDSAYVVKGFPKGKLSKKTNHLTLWAR